MSCRTAALGGNLYTCRQCGHQERVYNPCQDRHCPKCHRRKQADWVEARSRDLLPIPYFHVVFTVPKELHALFLANRKVAYGLLFRAAAETLKEVAATRLKAKVGILAVVHTWTQTLLYHPHVHCIVTGGGLSLDGEEWVACKPNFFLSVRVLGLVYRGKLLDMFNRALQKGKLNFDVGQAQRSLRQAARKRWVVYAKAPFAGPEVFLKYISRYVHRVAIDDRRILAYDGKRVTFQYRDRRHGDTVREMTLSATAFLRRFLLHLLPKGFMKIRSYGLLSNGQKKENLKHCRELLPAPPEAQSAGENPLEVSDDAAETKGRMCPTCAVPLVLECELAPDPKASARSP